MVELGQIRATNISTCFTDVYSSMDFRHSGIMYRFRYTYVYVFVTIAYLARAKELCIHEGSQPINY